MLVDKGAAMVCLPNRMIEQLGLQKKSEKYAQTAHGDVLRSIYSPATVTIMDRDVDLNVMEIPDTVPPLLGYLALEALDLVVNPRKQILEGNPDHNGKFLIDLL